MGAESIQLAGMGAQIGGSLYKGMAAQRSAKYNARLARQEGAFEGAQLDLRAQDERAAGYQAAQER